VTHAELQDAIVSAWKAQKPGTPDAALAIAAGILSPYPKELKEFNMWFQVNGASALKRVVNG
jgi:hypothetical protein